MSLYGLCGTLSQKSPPCDNDKERIIKILKDWNNCPIEDIKFVKENLGIPINLSCRPSNDFSTIIISKQGERLELLLVWKCDNYMRATIPWG